jgi:hypothetical protein
VFAQQGRGKGYLAKKYLIGTWQRNDSIIGSGLNQNFEFFEGDTFVLNVGNDEDDVRNVTQLKGKYRIIADSLFFTITSRTVVDGPIEIPDSGISLNIFLIKPAKVREIFEQNPRELSVPCYITLFTNGHIKINREDYYKIK